MRKTELNRQTKNVRSFFAEFASFDFKDLSATKVRTFLNTHHFPQNATASCGGAMKSLGRHTLGSSKRSRSPGRPSTLSGPPPLRRQPTPSPPPPPPPPPPT